MSGVSPYVTYTSYGESLVAFSALEAGGFDPVLANEALARLNHFEALALGGYWIYLPDAQQDEARDWQRWLQTQAQPDEDDTPAGAASTRYWPHTLVAVFLMFGGFWLVETLVGAVF